MQKNNLFSLQRFMMLFKQSLITNRKLILISLVGVVGIIFVTLMLFQSMKNYNGWKQDNYMITFVIFFFTLGINYSSRSFHAFRTKEKSMAYLMIPVSTSEKFVYELLTRIVVFILFMPLLFWIVANLEGTVVHYYKSELINYKFSFHQTWTEFAKNRQIQGWGTFAIIQGVLFSLIVSFTGACHFSKSPRTKTFFTLSVIVGGYALFTYLSGKSLNLKDYAPSDNKILFMNINDQFITFLALAGMVINLSLLAITYFILKEKEV